MAAYYNEIDAYAAQWLRNLIRAGHIADGDVDERSIADVRPDDLRGYTQAHFFAGIGGWSYALRLAGWPDTRPVWTGSCPCPPFSSAGKRLSCPACKSRLLVWCPRRTGYAICADCGNAWLADARHLWPELWRLIAERRPARVYGEQVASEEGLVWLAAVRGSLEIIRYDVGASDLPACSVGAPHIRQRIWWMADAGCGWVQPAGRRLDCAEAGAAREADQRERVRPDGRDGGAAGELADAEGNRCDGVALAGVDRAAPSEHTKARRWRSSWLLEPARCGPACAVGDAESGGRARPAARQRDAGLGVASRDGGMEFADGSGRAARSAAAAPDGHGASAIAASGNAGAVGDASAPRLSPRERDHLSQPGGGR